MDVIAAAFPQCVAAVADHRQRLPLLYMLALGYDEGACSEVGVVTVFAAMIDADVIPERAVGVVLPRADVVQVYYAGTHGNDGESHFAKASHDAVSETGQASEHTSAFYLLQFKVGSPMDSRRRAAA